MDLLLFGIQGCGKGTQAKRIAEEFGYDIFEAGGELRKIAAEESELGNTVKSYIDFGKLVPHEIIISVVKEAIRKRPADQKILFDGIPRDLKQMKDFNEIMKHFGREFRCIEITLGLEEAIQRIMKRAEIEGRADDSSEETVRERMATFSDKTRPVIELYDQAGKLTRVDGNGTIDEIYERITSALQE